jgi:N-acetylmuramoyl-L-alanine amidase
MTRVFFSPSQQEHNVGAGKYGRESDRCRIICKMAAELLKGIPDVETRVAADYTALDEPADYLSAVRESNRWEADVHVAVHSNAAGKGADGTDTFYFANSARGKRLASCLQRRVGPVSPGSDGGIHAQSGWAELNNTSAVACLIEVGFHTDPADAVSIIAQPGLYAAALADGICDYLHIKRSTTVPVDPQYKKAKDAFTKLPKALREKFLKWAPKWRVAS